jgi:hypothetical protein
MWYSNLTKYINVSTYPPPTLTHQCVETRSTEVFWLLSQPHPHLRFNLFVITFVTQLWTALHDKHFHCKQERLWIFFAFSPFAHRKTHNGTLLFGRKHLKYGRHFDYWNRPLNMRIPVCYLDCHEAGLRCYLVVHIENLSRPLLHRLVLRRTYFFCFGRERNPQL